MKHLKGHFSIPTTMLQVKNSDEILKSVKNADLTENVLNVDIDENVGLKKWKRKRKKKRKVSDPAVRDVTELLSTNLKLISPSKTPESKNVNLDVDFSGRVIKEIPPTPMKENTPKNSASIPKRDAFQFMMERRNRSIGLNSPGKELDKDTNNIDNIDNKAKLASRRHIFSNWSDKKGAIKRKRFEEEKDEIIEHKLSKRARRLKNLLNVEEEETKKSLTLKFVKSRIRKLSSSSEDSNFDERDEIIESNKNKKRDFAKKKNVEIDIKNTNSIKTVKKAKNQYKELENNQTPVRYNKGNILSFIKSEQLNNIKREENDSVKDKSKTKSNKCNKSYKINTKNKNIHTKHKDDKISEKNIENSYSNMKDTFPKGKQKKKKETRESINVLDESSQESMNFTPRILRSWKMKIKVNMDGNGNRDLRTKNQIKYAEDCISIGIMILNALMI